MGRQRWVYRVEPGHFPEDFPRRLVEFKEAAGFSWRGLARELRVDIRLIKRWRNGVKPDSAHLVALFSLAARLGLLHLLLPEAEEFYAVLCGPALEQRPCDLGAEEAAGSLAGPAPAPGAARVAFPQPGHGAAHCHAGG